MSVNDDFSWISQASILIQKAIDQGVPVICHCLGRQRMSKALGVDNQKSC